MDENHHYDLAVCKSETGYKVIERLNIGDIKSIEYEADLGNDNHATLIIRASHEHYSFLIHANGKDLLLGTAQTRYLSSEVAGGFTGVLIGSRFTTVAEISTCPSLSFRYMTSARLKL